MDPTLLDILRCPDCGGPVAFRASGADEGAGSIECGGCSTGWLVTRGIPRFVSPELAKEVRETGQRFGESWAAFPELWEFYEKQFLAWVAPLRPEDYREAVVLDAGCGKGRHLALAQRWGSALVAGVDVGPAVETARHNSRDMGRIEILQADLHQLPFGRAFDVIHSVGVIHHLPDPAAGFRALARHLKPGGRIAVWVYGWEGNAWIRHLFDPVRKHVLRRLPPFLLHPLAWLAAVKVHAMVRLVYAPAERRLPWLHRLLPYRAYLTHLCHYNFREVRSIVYDQMVAPTTHYIRREEVEGWLRDAGLEETSITQLRGMSWRGYGRAPA